MALKVGIVGLPNVGKSTLFNALLKKRVALSANYPFATIEPNVGVVAVPDGRLGELGRLVKDEEKMENLPPLVPAVVEFVDIAGLVKGASTGAGLGNQFLSHIREVDAIIEVVRDFNDENVIREGSENPDADKIIIETELGLSDLSVVEKLISAQEKQAKVSKDMLETEKLQILHSVSNDLNNGKVLGNYHVGDERLKSWFATLPLLTIKPLLYVYNVSENEYAGKLKNSVMLNSVQHLKEIPKQVRDDVLPMDDKTVVICAKLEEELADYSEEDRKEYLHELGIEETGLERLIKKAYELLGLISFLTAGKKEVRAWTIKKGTLAPQAAGVIHTDFEKGFIRAQVIEYQKLLEAGSHSVAKLKGWVRTEGKTYIMQDGDIVEFLVSA